MTTPRHGVLHIKLFGGENVSSIQYVRYLSQELCNQSVPEFGAWNFSQIRLYSFEVNKTVRATRALQSNLPTVSATVRQYPPGNASRPNYNFYLPNQTLHRIYLGQKLARIIIMTFYLMKFEHWIE